MASFVYTNAAYRLLIDIDLINDDIRGLLVMTDTTVNAEEDASFIDEFTTLDEFDDASYDRVALANNAIDKDEPNDRAEFSADNLDFGALDDGTREIQGAVIFKFVTDDTDSVPIAYIEFAAPFNPGGLGVVIQWNPEGIIQFVPV